MRNTIQIALILLFTGAALTALGGCSVNVIVAPGASVGLNSNNLHDASHTATQYNDSPELVRLLAGDE